MRLDCPRCGEDEDLSGRETSGGIRIECGSCGASWLRDAEPETCASCGGTDVVRRPQALTQYARGTQLSIVGMGDILLCRVCDARMVDWSRGSRSVPPSYRSSAQDPDAASGRDDEGDVLITP
jgi:DnaJ-class molecular chaperone